MQPESENAYIQSFLRYHRNEGKYISNAQIEAYFLSHGLCDNTEAIQAFYDYYSKIEASRKIIQQYWQNSLSEPLYLIEFKNSLRIRRYSSRTVKAYVGALYAAHLWFLNVANVGLHEIDAVISYSYFLYLTDKKRLSYSTVRVRRFAVEYYFIEILKKGIDLSFMNRMKKNKPLPSVLSRDEIRKLLRQVTNSKHRLMLALMYASGLRVSEIVNLKAGDISVHELTLMVRQGKGQKDRMTVFSDKLKGDLETLLLDKNPVDYLFTSSSRPGQRLSVRSIQAVFKRALIAARINKDASCHDLRHSFATHLLENGPDIRYIQTLLGHKNLSTTVIYTKVTQPDLKGIRSPL